MHAFPPRASTVGRHRLTGLGGLMVLAQAAFAQDTSSPGTLEATLPDVAVRSSLSQSPLEQLPASITVIDGERLRASQWQVNLSEALPAAPGLLIQNRQNYAQDLQLSIRGHGARSTFGVRGVQIFVDDIPTTMPDGQGQTSNIDLASVERIEVLRGPYSALYGNASGGVISAYTERGEGPPSVQSSFATGSDGQKRMALKAQGESHGLGYVLSASRFLTVGWRRHSSADKNLFNARLDTTTANGDPLTLVASHVAIDAQDPGGLTTDAWKNDPRAVAQGPLDFNARKNTRQTQAGLTYEHRLDAANSLRLMVYAGQRQITQYQSTPVAAQKPPTSAGGVIDLGRDYAGLDVRWAQQTELAGSPLRLVAGLAANIVEEDRKGYNNFAGNQLGVMGDLRRNERNTLSNIDPYLQASWAFASGWKAEVGLRWSHVRVESRDHYLGNSDDSGNTRFQRLLPVVSLQYQLSEGALLYASAGSGLETPTFNELSYRPAGQSGLNFGLQAANATSAEVGLRQRFAGNGLRGEWTAALFQTNTRNEIVAAENQGGRTSYQNAGRTRRQGLELSSTLWLGSQLRLDAALTLLDAQLRQGFCDAKGVCTPAGNRLAGTARHQAWLALEWRPAEDWKLGLDWRHIGRIAANDSNSVFAPAYNVLGASAGYTRSLGHWRLQAYARLDNLMDKRYVSSVIVNESNGRFYESAPGRQWMAGLNLSYQF